MRSDDSDSQDRDHVGEDLRRRSDPPPSTLTAGIEPSNSQSAHRDLAEPDAVTAARPVLRGPEPSNGLGLPDKTSGLFPRAHIDIAKVAVVGQVGEVRLTEASLVFGGDAVSDADALRDKPGVDPGDLGPPLLPLRDPLLMAEAAAHAGKQNHQDPVRKTRGTPAVCASAPPYQTSGCEPVSIQTT